MTDTLRLLVPIALKEVFEYLAPRFSQAADQRLEVVHALNPEMPGLIASGEDWDLVLTNPHHIEAILSTGAAKPGSEREFARTPLAFARLGQDGMTTATTSSEIKTVLARATQIGITDAGTSGGTFRDLTRYLDIASDVGPRIVPLGAGEPMRALLDGRIDLAALPLTNIAPIAGVWVAGVCPIDWGVHIDLSLCLRKGAPAAAQKMADWLMAPAREPDLERLGASRFLRTSTVGSKS